MDLFATAQAWLAAGRSPAFATVVATSGSVPRHPGARMMVAADGESIGTIGGGRVEMVVVQAAARVATGEAAEVAQHHLVRDLAMCCGGSMTMLIEPVARSADVLGSISGASARRESVTLTSSIDAPMVLDPGVTRSAPSWDGQRFIEPRRPSERALVFGAGHVATALIGRLISVGFEVIVCDDNEVGAADRVRPLLGTSGRVVESFDLHDVETAIGRVAVGDFALVLTRDHAIDQRLVEQLFARPELSYLGLIGSLGKVGRFRKRILAKGIVDDAGWSRLSAPIGVDILAETPEEIAISIAADLIRRRAELRRGPP